MTPDARRETTRHVLHLWRQTGSDFKAGYYIQVVWERAREADKNGHSGPDGIGPDTMSYGFASRPNREGTPFGRAGYHLSHVLGDWYVFSASNDY